MGNNVALKNRLKKWNAIYYEWQNSNLTQAEFSKDKGISLVEFKNRLRQISYHKAWNNKPKEVSIARASENMFKAMHLGAANTYCKIQIQGVGSIIVEDIRKIAFLKKLLLAMESC